MEKGRKTLISLFRFDFGNCSVHTDCGFIKLERLYQNVRYMWVNELHNRWYGTDYPTPLRDLVFAEKGEFRIGLPAGEYCIRTTYFDPNWDWRPFPIVIGSTSAHAPIGTGTSYLQESIQPEKGQVVTKEYLISHTGGVLFIGFPEKFFINGLELLGEEGTILFPLYPEAPDDQLPEPFRQGMPKEETLTETLTTLCDWICESRQPDGFIGDFEGEQRLWYTSSYPIRTLMEGYARTGQQRYYDAAEKLLDLLVSEQMPEGGFTQSYRGQITAELTEAELAEVREKHWMNLADVGSMVAALAVSCYYSSGEKKARYCDAVRHYLDDWALRYRRPEGGFTNGWVLHPAQKIYSVSTATTALSLALFYQLTGEEKYLRYAEDAAVFLADKWQEEGRNFNYIYDGTYPGVDHYQDVNEFGDGFYTMEALSAVLWITNREEIRKCLFTSLKKYLFGSAGLLKLLGNQAWWELQNNWHNSKSAGNPILLYDFLHFGSQFGATAEEMHTVRQAYENCMQFLMNPACRAMLGIAVSDPQGEYPFSVHSIQSWSGCAAAATGFAGISILHALHPGSIYLHW